MKSPPVHAAISFSALADMSDPETSQDERNAIAKQVFDAHGSLGMMSLWLLQGYFDPIEPLNHLMTPLTQWWLNLENPYTYAIRQELAQYATAEEAKACLEWATRVPQVEHQFSRVVTPANNDDNDHVISANDQQQHSELAAIAVRQLAQTFFPQWPELALPTCPLYQTTLLSDGLSDDDCYEYLLYANPCEAFADDDNAMQYLVRKLPQEVLPEKWKAHPSNEQWNMFEQLGLSLEDSFTTAQQTHRTPKVALALPQDVWEP